MSDFHRDQAQRLHVATLRLICGALWALFLFLLFVR